MNPKFFIAMLCCCCCLAACGGGDDPLPDPKPTPDPEQPVDPEPTDPVTGKSYYVSPDGADSNNGGSSAFPLKSFTKVLTMIKPGDIVYVMPGTYTASGAPILNLLPEHSGEADKDITFKAYDPANKPRLSAGGRNVWNAIVVNASYVVLDGLELEGYNATLDSLTAYNIAYNQKYGSNTDWAEAAAYNTNGITIGGPRTDSKKPHHVTVRNCTVHDFPGGGVGCQQGDYVTIEHNRIYNNAWYNMYACSGISILTPVNTDNATGYKNFIRGNVVYNNMCKIPWTATKNFTLSDGNGIIIDVNNEPASDGVATGQGEYTGRTLVCNNVTYGNGGSGIHSFKAYHVDIVNNTAYHNTRKYDDGTYAEIWTNQCKDVNLVNNIMYARPGGLCNMRAGNATEVYDYNLCFGGKINTTGTHDKNADPLFVRLALDATADFHLKEGSPAIGHGTRTSYTPDSDIEGNARSQRVDAGAYQYK
jgi:hypothetical protein